jgi:hypothetical protein
VIAGRLLRRPVHNLRFNLDSDCAAEPSAHEARARQNQHEFLAAVTTLKVTSWDWVISARIWAKKRLKSSKNVPK